MITILLGCLVAAVLYLGMRWFNVTTENAQLKAHIETLKRRLASREG